MFAIISNLALLIPAITAWKWRRILRCVIFIFEAFISMFYHLCDYYNICIFGFTDLHYFDFFFAEFIIPLNIFYLIDFSYKWKWLEWVMLFVAALAIALLKVWFPSTLLVQAAISITCVVILVLSWIFWGFPKYKWNHLTLGIALLSLSIILYVYQNLYSPMYDIIHGLWHIAAAFGSHYIIISKEPAGDYENAASRISSYGSPLLFRRSE